MKKEPSVADCVEMIGEGFMQLAFALRREADQEFAHKEANGEDPPFETEEEPAKEPVDAPETPEDDEDGGEGPDTQEEPEITLETLQELGAKLLKAGERDKFIEILAESKLKNLSSATKNQYGKLHRNLTEAVEGLDG